MIAQPIYLFHRHNLAACHKTGKIYQLNPQILYVVQGCGIISTEHSNNSIKQRHLIYIPAHLQFMVTSQSNDFSYLCVSLIVPLPYQPVANQSSGLFLTQCSDSMVADCYHLMEQIPEDAVFYQDSIEACQRILINYLLNQTSNLIPSKNYSPMIQQILTYMQSHLTKNICLRDLAQQAQLSASQFSNRFKNELGISPMAYLHHLRLNQIYYQLCKFPQSDIDQLRQAYAFNNPNYFSTAFKNKFSMTPLQIKKLAQSPAGHLMLPEEIDFFTNKYPQV